MGHISINIEPIVCIFIIIALMFVVTAYFFNMYMKYVKEDNKHLKKQYEKILKIQSTNDEYLKYIERIETENNLILKEIKDTIDTNTNALMSIPNYIPNKAEYNGQEITLKRVKNALFGDTSGKIKTFAIISPENPMGISYSRKENEKRLIQFKDYLRFGSYSYT